MRVDRRRCPTKPAAKLREHIQRRELPLPAFLLQRFVAPLTAVKPQGRKHLRCLRSLRDPISNR
jgi:hypothetical protein